MTSTAALATLADTLEVTNTLIDTQGKKLGRIEENQITEMTSDIRGVIRTLTNTALFSEEDERKMVALNTLSDMNASMEKNKALLRKYLEGEDYAESVEFFGYSKRDRAQLAIALSSLYQQLNAISYQSLMMIKKHRLAENNKAEYYAFVHRIRPLLDTALDYILRDTDTEFRQTYRDYIGYSSENRQLDDFCYDKKIKKYYKSSLHHFINKKEKDNTLSTAALCYMDILAVTAKEDKYASGPFFDRDIFNNFYIFYSRNIEQYSDYYHHYKQQYILVAFEI